MANKRYSIFGAGAAGLYTAWRLLNGEAKSKEFEGKLLQAGDTLELCDWGRYDFSKEHRGTRTAGARICTWFYDDKPENSYLELGGMRYAQWDGTPQGPGHRLVTTVIAKLGLDRDSETFNVAGDELYYLRTKNFLGNDVSSQNPAPYNTYGASQPPDNGFTIIQDLALEPARAGAMTRREWCHFYNHGRIEQDTGSVSVFRKGDRLRGIGYWDLLIDQLGAEGFAYTSDGNGYSSNVINWHSAVAIQSNNDFTPGTDYKTLKTGYSNMFNKLFDAIVALARKKNVNFEYKPDTRLHSILAVEGQVRYTLATRANPDKKSAEGVAEAAFMAMPPFAINLVAQATQYVDHPGHDVLNHSRVRLFLGSAIQQPSYKIGMFFDSPWWLSSFYQPQLVAYEVTQAVLAKLGRQGFPKAYLEAMKDSAAVFGFTYSTTPDLVSAVQKAVAAYLTFEQQQLLIAASERDTIGPSVTDLPIRQVVYFGNNALDQSQKPVYGILASYDDESFTSFWQELELDPDELRKVPLAENLQPLQGPRPAPEVMVRMLRQQLAFIHFGPQAKLDLVPKPLSCAFMDWSLPPFNAGYHAYGPHYDVAEVQQMIRKPSQLTGGGDAEIYIVGEAFSNDQAWVEGAYCTAESVLNDFFGVEPIIDPEHYPFICPLPE